MTINKSRYMLRKLQSKLRPVTDLSKKEIFKIIKPSLIAEFETYLSTINIATGLKKKNTLGRRGPVQSRGPKRHYNLDNFFDILFAWLDNGFKYSYIIDEYKGRGGGSFARYLKLLQESGIIEKRWKLSRLTADKNQLFIIDSFTVKSIDGTECTGTNYLDRGRRGTKVTLVSNSNKVITNILITPANKAEVTCLRDLLGTQSLRQFSTLLSDRGYHSKKLSAECQQQHIKLLMDPKAVANVKRIKERTFICKGCKLGSNCTGPKRCSRSSDYLKSLEEQPPVRYSHAVTKHEKTLLKKHRNRIEHVNGEIRRFRSANLKCVRRIKYYTLLITLGALLVNIFHNGFC